MTDVPAKDAMEAGSEAGFTLVELLVELALFSLLATLLFGNVHFGLHVWRSGSVHAEQFERSLISQDLLRRTIGNLYPMAVMKEGNQPQIVFDGTKGAVVFLSNAPTVAAAGGRFRYKIFVERRDDRADMMMTATPELADMQDASTTTKTLLLPDIDQAAFSYLGEARKEKDLRWNDNWEERSDVPRLVRIRVSFRSGDTRT